MSEALIIAGSVLGVAAATIGVLVVVVLVQGHGGNNRPRQVTDERHRAQGRARFRRRDSRGRRTR